MSDEMDLSEPSFETPAPVVRQKVASKKVSRTPLRDGGKRTPLPSKDTPTKKPHRFKPGTRALKEVRKAQKHEGFFVPKAPFHRLVREVVQEGAKNHPDGLRISARALEALQLAFESESITLMSAMEDVATSEGRKTVMPKDILLLKRLFLNYDLRALLQGEPLPLASLDELEVALEKLGTDVAEARKQFPKCVDKPEAAWKMIHYKCYDLPEDQLVKITRLEPGLDLRERAFEYLTTRKERSSLTSRKAH